MSNYLKSLAALMLASTFMVGQAQTTATSTITHKRKTPKKAVIKKPSVESQIEQLRHDMDTKIQSLTDQLAQRDQQLQAARDQAAAAQATAQQAQQAAQAQQQAVSDTNQQVTTLSSAVTDLKSSSTSMAQTIQDEQVKTKAAIENPSVMHYKGITLTPGGYLAAESIFRNRATGGDIATPFSAIPYENADAAKLTEFFGSGRQSRIALLAEGKLNWGTLRGYYEADFLGAGITSNPNQSNSYAMRQRVVWAQAELNSGFTFAGGQMWSLATETKKGLSNFSADIALPQTIDPNYIPGFVWTRQYGVRAVQNFKKGAVGISFENAQALAPGGTITATNYLNGEPGTGGGLYNPTANYSFNLAPDVIAKLALDPGWGHYEVFGIGRFFRNRIYPNATATTPSSAGAYNDKTVGGGVGGSFRVPLFAKKLDIGAKGLWGQGMGRYGDTTLPDLTITPFGQLALLRNFSGLATAELHATPRLDIYFNYGGDYAGRRYYVNAAGKPDGYGSPLFSNVGCGVEPVPGAGGFSPANPSTCAGNTRDLQEDVLGYWYDFYKGPKGRFRQGIQYAYVMRQAWSGVGGAPKGGDSMFWTSFRYYLP